MTRFTVDEIIEAVEAQIMGEPVDFETEKIEAAVELLKERKPGGWNVITKSPMDADERDYWSERLGYEISDDEGYMYGNLPDEGTEVLVCTRWGTVFIDSLCCDDGCCFEEHGEMDGIVAWMPLPKPYKEVDE